MRTDTSAWATLQLSGHIGVVRPAVAFLEEVALAVGLLPERAERLKLAVEEVLSNIIRHAYAGRTDGQIEIRCHFGGACLIVDFRETGLPFDFSQLPSYDASSDEWDPTGLGMHLVRQCVDEVQFENLGAIGKLIRLVVRTQSETAVFQDMDPPGASDDGMRESPGDEPVASIRPMVTDDAVNLAQCAYRTWGYGYNDYIYRPEEIRAMLGDGRLESVVAVQDGQVIGHAALKRRAPDDRVAEAGIAFVDPSVRSRSVMGRMVEALAARLPALNLEGLFAMQVTSHTISQKVGYAQGFRDCGLLIRAASRPEDDQLAGAHAQRRSAVVLCYRALGTQRKRLVFPPPSLKAWVMRAYAELGLSAEIGLAPSREDGTGAGGGTKGSAHLRSNRTRALRTADIEVLRHGHDTLAAVAHALRMHHRVGVDAVFLHLDLEDATTAELDDGLSAMGFIFAGILPNLRQGRDVLILQALNLTRADLDPVQLLTQFPKDVLDYARQQLATR
jgi:serine/threonine-protein kinase RsbW